MVDSLVLLASLFPGKLVTGLRNQVLVMVVALDGDMIVRTCVCRAHQDGGAAP